ncbi:MAG TPA: insulinase family protein [Caldithrix abyssi]|uniref:Insulinase family protein n=1 Tax=Caldithrix abyssi TaxID=187145 RepID=A0A7V4TYS4_CALAY|nr:insulinase family protein [Caldithrix abyssi]
MLRSALLFLLVIPYLVACSGASQETMKKANPLQETKIGLQDKLPVDPSIITGTLDNGIRYYIRKNSRPENRAELRLVVNAGSILEDDDQQGVAHFVEHMCFNGSEHFHKQELVNFLESIGMRFGPDINAYTSFDETVYMLQVPTDSSALLEKGFLVLEDWAHGVSFEDEEIDKERGVVIEEWRLGRGADMRMLNKQLPIIFKNSRYAERLPIGKVEILENFSHDVPRRFYHDWYRPDLMAVIAVGDFDIKYVKGLITKHFARMANPQKERERKLYPVPGHKETLYAIASDPEATRSTVSLYYKLPVETDSTVKQYRKQIVESLFHGMLNQRFYELSQKKDPPFIYGYSFKTRMVRTSSMYGLTAMVKDNGILPGLEALLTEAKRVQQYGFTPAELERVKKSVLRNMKKAYEERNKTESRRYASEYIRNFLQDEPIPGIEYEYALYKQFLPGIHLEEVNRLGKEWITDSNRVFVVNSPEKEGVTVPTPQDLQQVMDKVQAAEVTAYVDDAVNKPLIEHPPAAGKIVEEKKDEQLGTTEWLLSNGARVLIKTTDFKNDEVLFSATSPGGYSHVADADLVAAKTAASVVAEGGLGAFSRIQLQKLLSGKIARVRPYISRYSEGFSGIASPDDLDLLFQQVYLYFTAPRKDPDAFASYKSKMEGFYQNKSLNPEAAFRDTLEVVMTSHHPRFKPFDLEMIQQMNLDKSFSIFKDRFADAGEFLFLFVGNVTAEQLKPLAETYLASLPATGRNESWANDIYPLPKGKIDKKVVKGVEPKSLVTIKYFGPFEWNLKNRAIVGTMADMLRIKLRERLREDKSGTYFVRSNSSFPHYPEERYVITISFGCSPDRVDELTREVYSQIDSLQKFANSEKYQSYLQKVREIGLRSFETNQKENRWWLNQLEFYYFHHLNPQKILQIPDRYKARNLQEIQKAANTYFNEDRYVRVYLVPEQVKK